MTELKVKIVNNLNIIFLILVILTGIMVNTISIDFSLFWQIPLGLLAFVGVFYSVVYKREFVANRDNLLKKIWQSKYPKIRKLMIRLDKIFKEGNIKYILKATENEIQAISNEIIVFSEEHQKVDFDYYMLGTVIFSFATIIFSAIAEFLPKPFYILKNLSLNPIAVALLFTTFYSAIKFLMSCYKIGLVLKKD